MYMHGDAHRDPARNGEETIPVTEVSVIDV
jgi:hypothetical protein